MAIYRMVNGKERLDRIAQTSFGKEGVLERWDLQRILRDQAEVLEDKLLIIYEEFGDWQDSKRKIDLLGLDDKGRLVVVELKRGETGEHMDLQAIRYAAMVANMTFEHIVQTYQEYLAKRASEEGKTVEENAAYDSIREHLNIKESDSEAVHTDIPRVILASEDFSKELTTCVMWLNDSWLRSIDREIKCVRLQPHRNGDEILIEASVAVPLPEEADYKIQLGKRQQETRESGSAKSEILLGGDKFNESIARADESYRPGLERLYECAIRLEESHLAELFTYVNGKGDYIQLRLWVPDGSEMLVSFNMLLFNGGVGEISLWGGWNERASVSRDRMNELVGSAKSPSGVRHRRLSVAKTYGDLEEILGAIREAYWALASSPSD